MGSMRLAVQDAQMEIPHDRIMFFTHTMERYLSY